MTTIVDLNLMAFFFLTASVHCALTSESPLSRAISDIIIDINKNKSATLHFLQCSQKPSEILIEILEQQTSLPPYIIENVGFEKALQPKWFNIIFISEKKDLFVNFAKNLKHTTYHPRGYYIIAVEIVLDSKQRIDLCREIFKLFFTKFYDNVNILFGNRAKSKALIYTFFPFDPKHLCYEVVPVLYNTFDGRQFARKTRHFPEKLKKLNGCPIDVVFSYNPPFINMNPGESSPKRGIDIKTMDVFKSQLNFEIVYIFSEEKGVVLGNGTATGAFKMLLDDVGAFAIGGYSKTIDREKYFSGTVSYFYTEYVFAMPVVGKFDSLERLFLPLRKEVWIIFLLICLSYFTFLEILKKLQIRSYTIIVGQNMHSTILDIFQMFFEVSFHKIPSSTFASIWLLSHFVISCFYRSKLVEILASSGDGNGPKTINELNAMKYEISIRPQLQFFAKLLDGSGSRFTMFDGRLGDNLYELQIPSGRRRAVIELHSLVEMFNSENYRKGYIPVLRERLQQVTGCMMFKKNFYLITVFDDLLQRLVESGLINKWTEDMVNLGAFNHLQKRDEPKKLKWAHVEGTFEISFIVLAFAFLIFLIEVLSVKLRSRISLKE